MIMATGNARLRRAQRMRRLYEASQRDRTPERFFEDFEGALRSGSVQAGDISIRSIFENFVADGAEIANSWNPTGDNNGVMLCELRESGAVDTSAFSRISGQVVYSEVLKAFNDPIYLADQVCTTEDTPFDGEIVPGIARQGDNSEVVGEGNPYPFVGLSEEFIRLERIKKRGHIVPVTKEAIFFDRTGLILERAREVTNWLAVNKEKRVLDAVLGITNHYNRNDGGLTAAYGDSAGTHNWDNLQASNGLVDFTDVENALLLFDALTDPNTGEPINVMGELSLIVPTALLMTALRVTNATNVHHVDMQANATTYRTIADNPLKGQFGGQTLSINVLSSPYVKSRTSSASTWFIGDPKRAFVYKQNWGITSVTAPPNSHDEFHRDIVQQFKVSERGQIGAKEPRYMVKCTA